MHLLEKFKAYIKKENLFRPTDKLLLAVSGGVDSVVLCDLCYRAGYPFAIAHCNFKLRGQDSDRDEMFVQQLANTYSVAFFVTDFDTKKVALQNKTSIEESARDLRYNWFKNILARHGMQYVLTGHHADDNIETVTMNFLRGTGVKGLRGILPKKETILRPLLFARRAELESYVAQNNIAYVTDATNAEDAFTRNYFRNTLLPVICQRFPETKENILKNIHRFREIEVLYQQAVQLHKSKLVTQKGEEVHIPVLKLLKVTPLATVLYEIIKGFNFTSHQTEEAIALLKSETGKYISSPTHRIIKNRNWLVIAPLKPEQAGLIVIGATDKKITFTGGKLRIEMLDATTANVSADNAIAMLDAAEITFPLLLRKWKQGDYFYPLGMKKKKKINRFLSDAKLSIPQKENTWVLEMDKKIIWVVGMRIDDRFKVLGNTRTVCRVTVIKY